MNRNLFVDTEIGIIHQCKVQAFLKEISDFTDYGRREEIAFTARPKIQSQSQIFRYGRSIFCLPHRPNFSDIFDLCLHWVSVVCVYCHAIAVVSTYSRPSNNRTVWNNHTVHSVVEKKWLKTINTQYDITAQGQVNSGDFIK